MRRCHVDTRLSYYYGEKKGKKIIEGAAFPEGTPPPGRPENRREQGRLIKNVANRPCSRIKSIRQGYKNTVQSQKKKKKILPAHVSGPVTTLSAETCQRKERKIELDVFGYRKKKGRGERRIGREIRSRPLRLYLGETVNKRHRTNVADHTKKIDQKIIVKSSNRPHWLMKKREKSAAR